MLKHVIPCGVDVTCTHARYGPLLAIKIGLEASTFFGGSGDSGSQRTKRVGERGHFTSNASADGETGNSIADTITKELHNFGADRSWATCHIVVSFYASGQRAVTILERRNPHVAGYLRITWREQRSERHRAGRYRDTPGTRRADDRIGSNPPS